MWPHSFFKNNFYTLNLWQLKISLNLQYDLTCFAKEERGKKRKILIDEDNYYGLDKISFKISVKVLSETLHMYRSPIYFNVFLLLAIPSVSF